MQLPTSEKLIAQLSALPVILCTARRRSYSAGRIMQPKCHLPNAYKLLVTRYDQFCMGVWVTFSKYFRGKGTSPTKHCWCQKTRVIALSCGIKVSTVHHLVLSQYTHLTDRRTDRRTDGRTCSRTVKNLTWHTTAYIAWLLATSPVLPSCPTWHHVIIYIWAWHHSWLFLPCTAQHSVTRHVLLSMYLSGMLCQVQWLLHCQLPVIDNF